VTSPSGPFTVAHDSRSGVAVLTLHGTAVGNAMGALAWSGLPELAGALAADPAVRAVVVTGAGDCFSAGLDLRWYLTHYRRMVRDDAAGLRTRLFAEAGQMQRALSAIADSRLPFVAAVHGACTGAGLDLAAACDIRFAAADAVFSVREVRIGVVADLGSLQRLPRLIGAAAAMELALTGRDMDAGEACQRGLVSRVLPTAGVLLDHARAVAAQIASYPPHVAAGIKDVLSQSQEVPLPAALRYAGLWNAAFMPTPEFPQLLADAMRESMNGQEGPPREAVNLAGRTGEDRAAAERARAADNEPP
jgi:enoyl-CoA hydratase/carnithine racemase